MRQSWLWVWIALLVAQLITLGIGRQVRDRDLEPVDPVDAEVLELARLTNTAWQRLAGFKAAGQGPAPAATPGEELVSRQALLLRLRETERELAGDGAEIRLVEDLQAWLPGMDPAGGPAASRFLARLLDWLAPFADSGGGCRIERLFLLPSGKAGYPALCFELSGAPASMGSTLLAIDRDSGCWRLDEMDLYQPDARTEWWLRGSCSFSGETLP